jgi:hypothetical protein
MSRHLVDNGQRPRSGAAQAEGRRRVVAACTLAVTAGLTACSTTARGSSTLTHGTAPAPSAAVQGFDAFWGPYAEGTAEPTNPVDSLAEAKERADLIVVGRVTARGLDTSAIAGGTVDTLTVAVSRTLKGSSNNSIYVDLARVAEDVSREADPPERDSLWILTRGDTEGTYFLLGGNTAASTDETGTLRQIKQMQTPDQWFPERTSTFEALVSELERA